MSKKKWSKPELIVLVKGQPAEAVLTGCKGENIPTASGGCDNSCVTAEDGCVSLCSEITLS